MLRLRFEIKNEIGLRTDIASGKLRVSQIRDVDINDLLGRETVQLDLDLIEAFAKNKTILVTGAGGSIGSEMCRQLCNFNPELLLLIEQAENPLFYIERELRRRFPNVSIKAIICNITDKGANTAAPAILIVNLLRFITIPSAEVSSFNLNLFKRNYSRMRPLPILIPLLNCQASLRQLLK